MLDVQQPYINLTPHAHRRLKTDGSERIIPLVGFSFWAAKRIKENTSDKFCFPRYCDETSFKSNSASAAVNKWLKTIVGSHAFIQGLRHGFRDRLRSVEAPVELIDQLGGWSLSSVGEGYGDGYPIKILTKWMSKLT